MSSSMSVDFFDPTVDTIFNLDTGNVVLKVGKYPSRANLFFKDTDALLDFISSVLKESGVNYYTWEHVDHIEETVSVSPDMALNYN